MGPLSPLFYWPSAILFGSFTYSSIPSLNRSSTHTWFIGVPVPKARRPSKPSRQEIIEETQLQRVYDALDEAERWRKSQRLLRIRLWPHIYERHILDPMIDHLNSSTTSDRTSEALCWVADRMTHGFAGDPLCWEEWVQEEAQKAMEVANHWEELPSRAKVEAVQKLARSMGHEEKEPPLVRDERLYNLGWFFQCLSAIEKLGLELRRCLDKKCKHFFVDARSKGKRYCSPQCSTRTRGRRYYQRNLT